MNRRLFFLIAICLLALSGCKGGSGTAGLTPHIPIYNSQGLPGHEHTRDTQNILGHPVIVRDGWLQPWMDYDTLLVWSMNFIVDGPVYPSGDGFLPAYLVTSSYSSDGPRDPSFFPEDGIFRGGANINNQGGNAYFAMKLFRYYYPYTGDKRALIPVREFLDRMMMFRTPEDWAWPGMVRVQDNDNPDGIYLDERLETDKAGMVGVAYLDFAKYTGEKKYREMGEHIARLLLRHIQEGSAEESPLPFRVNMRTGEPEDVYTSDMIFVVEFLDKLLDGETSLDKAEVKAKRDLVFNWVMDYPMKNGLWSGYFEDVKKYITNMNQFAPMETARYLLNNPEADPDWKQHVLDLLAFVKGRFGGVTRYGGTSVCEQDVCFGEMGSHTARYGSVLARWSAAMQSEQAKKEALSTLALAEYMAYNSRSKGNMSVNSVGIDWFGSWYSDSYFDYLPHFLEGMAAWPEMIPEGTDHLFQSTSMILDVSYEKGCVKYTACDDNGTERLKLSFRPKVFSGGKPLPKSQWSFGKWRDCDGILTIHRKGVKEIEVVDRDNYIPTLLGRPVVLKDGTVQPWLNYDSLLTYSMNFLKDCGTIDTPDGPKPAYLVTSKFNEDGTYPEGHNRNNQGGNAYFGMRLFRRYYPYSGDREALRPVGDLLDRMADFPTPEDWAWPGMVRTQDNDNPDGVYLDERIETDKAAMAAIAYLDYARFTGENRYDTLALHIASLLLANTREGNAEASPLPFRINMRTGEVEDAYTSDMIFVVELYDRLLAMDTGLDKADIQAKRDLVLKWILDYPVKNGLWSGYFEDVEKAYTNLNQFAPMETARYFLDHPEADPQWKQDVPALLAFVKDRFGKTVRYGGTSIREQDVCFIEMSSHAARYASVLAKWAGETGDKEARKEALATFALAEYSAYNRYSEREKAINSTGLGYPKCWFSDSYFDYLPHYLEGMAAWPEMIPEGTDHLFQSTSMILDVSYADGSVKYTASEGEGTERLKLSFKPAVLSGGNPLAKSQWSYGKWRGCSGILTIQRKGEKEIEIVESK